jgi:DtxR family Mn-dependent transcriptional regulator
VVSSAMEDYLAAIFRTLLVQEKASTSEIARRLKVSSASATAMFHKMASEGLVQYQEYAGVSLTPEGRKAAASVVRRHRIAERFLTDVLGIPWERVDEMADRLEHALPGEVVDSFEHLLGGATHCPHGWPIPTADGFVEPERVRLLASLTGGEEGEVRWVEEDDPGLLQYLAELGLVPGARVRVEAVNPVDDLMEVRVGERRFAVGQRVANAVAVGTPRAEG